MTQYEDIKEFIRIHPGTTRMMIRKYLPKITHENELLKRLVESGEGYREKVQSSYSKREVWGYFLC